MASMSHLYVTFISVIDSEFISNNIFNELIGTTNHSEVPPPNYMLSYLQLHLMYRCLVMKSNISLSDKSKNVSF